MKNNYHEKVIAVVQTAKTKRYILVFGLFESLIKVICRSFYTVQSYIFGKTFLSREMGVLYIKLNFGRSDIK